MTLEFEVTAGSIADVPAAQRILDGARQWLRARSIDQWQDPIPDSTLVHDAQRGHLFLVRDQGDVLAVVSIADDDTETWGATSGHAHYVHRLAIAQSHRGKSLGSTLLRWVCERASAAGKDVVRLDCAADNAGLRLFYEQRGFIHLRDDTVLSPTGARSLAVSLYEKRVRHAVELSNHWWWRPGWQIGTRYYTWHLTFPAEPPFRRLVGSYQQALSGFAQLDAVPMEWLHLTLVGVGDARAVTDAQVRRIADQVREEVAVLPPVALTFQRAVVLNEAVALAVEPNAPLADLRRMLTKVVSESLPAAPAPDVPQRAFVPHVSVAYVNADSAGLHVSRAVDQTPRPAAVVVSPLLSLIELHRDNRQYEWRTVEEIPLR